MTSRNDVQLRDENVRSAESYIDDSDIAVNGGFETWSLAPMYNDEYWDYASSAHCFQIWTTDSQTGTYADLVIIYPEEESISGIGQTISGLTSGDNYTISAYLKRVSSSDACYIFLSPGGTDYVWNFTGVNAGTWTVLVGSPSSDQISWMGLTDAYVQYTKAITAGPNNNIQIYFCSTASNSFKVDNVSCKKDGIGPETVQN